MKKIWISFIFVFFLLVITVNAQPMRINVTEIIDEVEPEQTAEFQIIIENNRALRDVLQISYDSLNVYPFSNFARLINIEPSQVKLEPGEKAIIDVKIEVLDTIAPNKRYQTIIKVSSLLYQDFKQDVSLLTYVVLPKDIIQIYPDVPDEITPGTKTTIRIKLKNRANLLVENAEISITSDLPGLTENLFGSILPKSEVIEEFNFTPEITTKPGDYTLNFRVYENNELRGYYTTVFSITQNPLIDEKEEESKGFLTTTTKITKSNNGNAPSKETIEYDVSFFNKLFTETSLEPTTENGKYIWSFTLKPDESYFVEITRNYNSIFYGFLVLIVVVLLLLWHVRTSVIIKKKILKLKEDRSGISEMKILLYVRNGKGYSLSAARVIDLVPSLMTLTEEYGTLKPIKVQKGERSSRLIWELGTINSKEERVISYKVKTKLQLGEAVLPPALIQFITSSNKIVNIKSGKLIVQKSDIESENSND